jgi:hypothetical protein
MSTTEAADLARVLGTPTLCVCAILVLRERLNALGRLLTAEVRHLRTEFNLRMTALEGRLLPNVFAQSAP